MLQQAEANVVVDLIQGADDGPGQSFFNGLNSPLCTIAQTFEHSSIVSFPPAFRSSDPIRAIRGIQISLRH
jgi:hypothetical protein